MHQAVTLLFKKYDSDPSDKLTARNDADIKSPRCMAATLSSLATVSTCIHVLSKHLDSLNKQHNRVHTNIVR